MGLLRYTKAMLEHAKGNEFQSARSLYVQEGSSQHKSCFSVKKDKDQDLFYQKCK